MSNFVDRAVVISYLLEIPDVKIQMYHGNKAYYKKTKIIENIHKKVLRHLSTHMTQKAS